MKSPQDELHDMLERILSSASIEELWELLLDHIRACGFHNVIYGFTRFHTTSGFGAAEDMLLLTNFGDEYVKGYYRDGLYRNAPMVHWAEKNAGAASWSFITEHYEILSEAEKEVVQFNRKHGITAGYTISFRGANRREVGAMGMCLEPFVGTQAEADVIWEKYGRELEVICNVAHLKILSFPLTQRVLTKRQREVLEWIGDGKTISDTAAILGLTDATIEKHLRLAREALGVETTAQAVLKASFHNQIYTW